MVVLIYDPVMLLHGPSLPQKDAYRLENDYFWYISIKLLISVKFLRLVNISREINFNVLKSSIKVCQILQNYRLVTL